MKLDSSNYILWKYQIISILRAYSFQRFVDGSNPCPPKYVVDDNDKVTEEENPAFHLWMSTDQALLTLINSTQSPSALALVVGQTTAQGTWIVLERRFTSISRANILNLKMELHNIMQDNDSIDAYMCRVKEIRDRLAAVGVHIDDEEILLVVLKGLSGDFDAISSAIRSRNDDLSFEDLHVLLHTE